MNLSTFSSVRLSIAISLASLGGSATTFAQLTIVDTTSAFADNLSPGAFSENFETFAPGGGQTAANFSGGTPTFSYIISTLSGSGNQLWAASFNTRAVSTLNDQEPITIEFTSGNVTAVGGNFFLTGSLENGIAGSLTLSITTVSHPTGDPNSPVTVTSVFDSGSHPAQPFRGFFAAPGDYISSITLQGFNAGQYATLDNLQVGTAVPEPSEWGLCFGVLGLGVAAVRRWRSAPRSSIA